MNARQRAAASGGTGIGASLVGYLAMGPWGLTLGIVVAVMVGLPNVLTALASVTSTLAVFMHFRERRWLFDDDDRTNRAIAYKNAIPLPPRPRVPELLSPYDRLGLPELEPPGAAEPSTRSRPRPGPGGGRSQPRPREGP